MRRLVVDCNAVPPLDIAEGDKENVAPEYFHVAVGFAGMVYVMRAVPALAAVEAPAIINCADPESPPSGAATSFSVGYSLAGVLSYLSPAWKVRL